MKIFGTIAADTLETGASGTDRAIGDAAKLFTMEERPRYLIQVSMEHRARSSNKLISVQLFRMTKGGFGHADELIRWCAEDGCLGHVPWDIELSDEELDGLDAAHIRNKPTQWPAHLRERVENYMEAPCVCPKCGSVAIRGELPDSCFFQLPTHKLATRLERIWLSLDGSAEVYLVRFKEAGGIQKAQKLYKGAGFISRSDRRRYKRDMEKARDRDMVHYTHKRLLKDVASGKSVARAFQDLLEA